ncbi:helix-turn-helix domain-containing protein [Planococcus antarcticus]
MDVIHRACKFRLYPDQELQMAKRFDCFRWLLKTTVEKPPLQTTGDGVM